MSVSVPCRLTAIHAGALIVTSISVGPLRIRWDTRISPDPLSTRSSASSSSEVDRICTSLRAQPVTVIRPEKLLTARRVPLTAGSVVSVACGDARAARRMVVANNMVGPFSSPRRRAW